jgi:hypothetical protein
MSWNGRPEALEIDSEGCGIQYRVRGQRLQVQEREPPGGEEWRSSHPSKGRL